MFKKFLLSILLLIIILPIAPRVIPTPAIGPDPELFKLLPSFKEKFETINKVVETYRKTYNVYDQYISVKVKYFGYDQATIEDCNIHILCIQLDMVWMVSLSKHQIAAIVGHELGHHHLRHLEGYWRGPMSELRADQFGVDLANRAGYRGCEIAAYWKQKDDLHGDTYRSKTHPHPYIRSLLSKCN